MRRPRRIGEDVARATERTTLSARVIDGKAVAAELREQLAGEVAAFAAEHGRPPGLATVLIGDDEASAVYVASKQRQCEAIASASATWPRTSTA
jgi:methylenetetrahydrofolate dehydrogenase (NADP+)/methenyltetrahydrofolate cyclohydrolase